MGEEGQMGKRDAAKISGNSHYGIKSGSSNPSPHMARSSYPLGISGTGRGGGGTGEHSIGLGSLNTIGHGGGGGKGSGYGRGAGGLGGRRGAPYGVLSLYGNTIMNTENYSHIQESDFLLVTESPLSTFSIDVDTASYSNVRRFLNEQRLPPKDAVRVEELINYFSYEYPQPVSDEPFSSSAETAVCPWNKHHLLTRIGIRARSVAMEERASANLVFLIDVSGSMWSDSKLPLLKQSMKMMVNQLQPKDRVAMVVYAGASGLVLESTPASKKQHILNAIHQLEAGGSTNGGAGIESAYREAAKHFVKNGINRVILATDGDFNVGVTSHGDLVRLIEEKRKTGVFLSVLGFGMGNYKDSTLEQLADKGNGNYSYIDSLKEARKVLVEQIGQTLVTVAKDVKIQVEFNPAYVQSYRLIGYENRTLAARDFNDDTKDAGEIGAGHTVTALYELVPADDQSSAGDAEFLTVDKLRYQSDRETTDKAGSAELYTLKLRYKKPSENSSKRLEFRVMNQVKPIADASPDFKFAASIAGFGMLLRESKWVHDATYDQVKQLARSGLGSHADEYRHEFIQLVSKAQKLTGRTAMATDVQ
ncbi:MAG: VWA domain-containing protein [Deltaproteobacteria bacterium]|nr:VWA domain-containing protein [Deltaproteobacteria bacterium]MBN2671292.1 VWA domain-containing protein [Deltaproteobacteria bacterium]